MVESVVENSNAAAATLVPGASGVSSSGQLSVSVELFEGPIDLLLHLVKQNELPIELVSLARIAEQYMAALDEMRRLDLEVAGEYLVVAATLVSIKAAVLLNAPVDTDTGLDTEESLSPHEELLRRLREAAVYRDGARELASKPLFGIDVFGYGGVFDVDLGPAPLKPHDTILLARALKRLLSRSEDNQKLLTITVDSVSITERMLLVLDKLKAAPGVVIELDELIDERTVPAIVGGLLAILELAKRQAIVIRQDLEFDKIFVAMTGVVMTGEAFDLSGPITSDGSDLDQNGDEANREAKLGSDAAGVKEAV